MATTVKEKVTVTELSKYGVKVGNEYYNWSKQIKEADKGCVVPGATFDMELYVADSGRKYINSVAALAEPASPKPAAAVKPEATKPSFVAKAVAKAKGEEMTRADWEEKDKRIGRAGVIQVAVQVTANFDDAIELANKMLKFIATPNANQG